MMTSAYDSRSVHNFTVLQESKRWRAHGFMDEQQFAAISEAYKVPFYHPGLVIRITLFFAGLLALSGISGMLGLVASGLGETAISTGAVLYGAATLVVLERNIITSNHHYKSGITEALLYHSCGFIIVGAGNLMDFDVHILLFLCLIVFTFGSIRYLDWLCSLAAGLTFAGIVFYEFYELDGVFRQIIPFVFIAVFTSSYFVSRNRKNGDQLKLWRNNLLIIEFLSLLLIYAGGNYLVVRELSISLMEMRLEEGQDIPFAGIFLGLTALLPLVYLFMGIQRKDVVLIRIGMIVTAFSLYTFHHYYGFGPLEITLTIAGAILLILTILLLRHLKIARHGFTGDIILVEKWADMNVQAFIVSQTLGGNEVKAEEGMKPGGGSFGGGGASGDF